MTSPPLLLRNAVLRTGPWAPGDVSDEPVWISTRAGRIEAVGAPGQPEPVAGGYRVIDLLGAVVLPGFVDSHTHLGWSAEDRWTVNWSETADLAGALAALRAVCARVTPGDWVTGGDWLPDVLPESALPGLHELDEVAEGRPVFLRSVDHSIALLNSRALALAGIGAHTPDPAGGVIERDRDGAPTGVLRGAAVWSRLAAGVVPPRNLARQLAEIRDALADLAARGVTEIHDIATYPRERTRALIHEERSFTDVRLIEALGDDLTLRYSFRPSLLRVAHFSAGVTPASPLISFAGFKVSLDNGWHSQPGGPRVDSYRWPGLAEAARLAKQADEIGAAISIHAMGDLGVAEALDLLSSLPSRKGSELPPHRVIHARTIQAGDIARCAELGVVIESQPWEIVDKGSALQARGDGAFAASISPYRRLLDAGVPLAFSSDRRLGTRVDQLDTDPLTGVQIAVTRTDPTGSQNVWQPGERITLTESLAAATVAGAVAAGAAARRGRIAPGFDADLVALGSDPWRLPAEDIAAARPVLTVSAGRVVYDKTGR